MQLFDLPTHPIIDEDRKFFKNNKPRRLRLRPYEPGEYGWDKIVVLFRGGSEVNITVVHQIYPGCRCRISLHCESLNINDSDRDIENILDKYGYSPTLQLRNKQ